MIPLLIQDAYSQTFSHRSDDFQLTMYEQGLLRPAETTYGTCVVVFTYSGDVEISKLSLDFARKGLRLVRINSDFPDSACIDGIDEDKIIIGNEILTPKLLWERHFFPQRHVNENAQNLFRYSFAQMQAVEQTLSDISAHTINQDVKDKSLLTQLSLAKSSGFNIPRGVITNDPAHAANVLQPKTGKLVVKALGSHWIQNSEDYFIGAFPKSYKIKELREYPKEPVPTFYQEYIEHDSEIRVYVINNTVIPYEITGKKAAKQLWSSPHSVKIKKIALPETVISNIRLFQKNMHFEYGAIDLLHGQNDSYTFLEINLDGDWNYFEHQSNDSSVRSTMLRFISQQLLG